ncbi:DUF2752 domain-containing protein [Streptomyces lavendulocolor]|uniref:DUF2752 domain-containing protein n=1 Tax=Streptomyces lavendulocolor TaxID=67316 RepID=UPI0033DE613A
MSGDNHPVDPKPSPAAPAPPPPAVPAASPPAPAAPAAAGAAAAPGAVPEPGRAPLPQPVPGPHGSRRPSLVRRIAPPLGVLTGVVAAFAYVGAVDPNEPGHYPVCPLFRLTGILCPGCGGLRSAHAFAHGDLVTALGANAVAVAGYLLFAVAMVFWLVGAVRGVSVRLTAGPVWWWSAGVVVALFSVVRNLPFGAALAP